MGGKASKKRLVHSVALTIINFVPLLKSLIANMLKCITRYETKFKCVCSSMHSLVISPFTCDYMKMEID